MPQPKSLRKFIKGLKSLARKLKGKVNASRTRSPNADAGHTILPIELPVLAVNLEFLTDDTSRIHAAAPPPSPPIEIHSSLMINTTDCSISSQEPAIDLARPALKLPSTSPEYIPCPL